ncbi:MAG: hypothetical protein J6Y01_01910, partial [Spirochaetales bacterium]|nr:hypothetical protein [Spirochaetales bacterium]
MTDNTMNEEELTLSDLEETTALWASWSDVEDEENYGDSYTDDEYEDDEDDEDFEDEDEDEYDDDEYEDDEYDDEYD